MLPIRLSEAATKNATKTGKTQKFNENFRKQIWSKSWKSVAIIANRNLLSFIAHFQAMRPVINDTKGQEQKIKLSLIFLTTISFKLLKKSISYPLLNSIKCR